MSDTNNIEVTVEDKVPKKGNKKLIIIAVIAIILLAVGAVLVLGGGGSSENTKSEEGSEENLEIEQTPAKDTQLAYLELPEFLVNLRPSGSKKDNFLKITISLEVMDENDIPKITTQMPKLIDAINVSLRDLRKDDLYGAGGMYILREEILLRVTQVLNPIKVSDVLFSNILIQ